MALRPLARCEGPVKISIAFSGEENTDSREEKAADQIYRSPIKFIEAPPLIPSEVERLEQSMSRT
jgi:hypothetical protein